MVKKLIFAFALSSMLVGCQHQLTLQESMNGVVKIDIKETDGSAGFGSGFFITDDWIMTNAHVANSPGSKLQLRLDSSPDLYTGVVVFADDEADVAIIKIKESEQFKKENNPTILKFASRESVEIGEEVHSIGHPAGQAWNVSSGTITGLLTRTSTMHTFYRTDALVIPGNSGGPSVDVNGNVVGMNAEIFGMTMGAGVGMMIPSYLLEKIVSDFKKYGQVRWASIGISMNPYAKLLAVGEKTPAERGGLQAKDEIVSIETKEGIFEVNNSSDRAIAALTSSDYQNPVTLRVRRNGDIISLTVKPGYKTSAQLAQDAKIEELKGIEQQGPNRH